MLHFGLIGKSLTHSFSRNFFTVKFQSERVNADYSLIEIEDISLIDTIIKERELSGFNVTIPYKESIIPYLDELSSDAEAVGAVNCVVVRQGKKIGYNTDIKGIDASLEWLTLAEGARALVLGSGGASKAVQHILKKREIEFSIVSREESRGNYTYDKLTSEVIKSHSLIINTTPVGMSPDVDSAPAIDYSALESHHRLFDLVYNPANTRFLQQGEERGAETMGGMLMLQTQAIASWHIWQRELIIDYLSDAN